MLHLAAGVALGIVAAHIISSVCRQLIAGRKVAAWVRGPYVAAPRNPPRLPIPFGYFVFCLLFGAAWLWVVLSMVFNHFYH